MNNPMFIKTRKFLSAFVLICYAGTSLSQTYAPGACKAVPGSQSCLDSTPCKQSATGETVCLSGVPLPTGAMHVAQTCWQYAYQYACTGQSVNTCATYESNPACGIVSSQCTGTTAETGQCREYTNTYKCQTKTEKTEKKMVCSSGLFDTTAMPTPANPNNSFATAAVAQEILRQGQVYGKNGIFSGVSETCTEGYFGIKNCCNTAPGAKSNAAVMGVAIGATLGGAKYAGEKIIDAASPYVFDAMYSTGMFSEGLENYIFSNSSAFIDRTGQLAGTNAAAGGFTVGAYGFTYGTGTMAAGSGLMGANTTLATFGSGSSASYISFNPYVFAAMVVIQVIQSLAACTEQEQMLAMHKGASLSTFISKDCSSKIPIVDTCIEWTSRYCSFNSVLAKIINIQGKPQLGLGVSDCAGMTPEQLSQLDFTKIDMSEFTQGVVNNAKSSLPTNISGNYKPIMQSTTQGTAQTNTPNLPSYPARP